MTSQSDPLNHKIPRHLDPKDFLDKSSPAFEYNNQISELEKQNEELERRVNML